MTFLEKLDFFLQREHLNRRGLSQKTGIPYTTIDNWYNRGYEGLRLSTAGRLAEFFGTTTDFLLRDDLTDPDYGKALGFQVDFGEMERVRKYRALDMYGKQAVDAVLEAEHQRMTRVAQREQKGWVTYINLYDLAVSAGTGEPLGDTYYTTRVELPTEKVPENAHCCLRVSGDSMEPAYKDGDIVFVQRLENGRLREGEVGIFSLNGEGYIKQLGQRQLLSFNPKYPPIPIGPYDRPGVPGQGFKQAVARCAPAARKPWGNQLDANWKQWKFGKRLISTAFSTIIDNSMQEGPSQAAFREVGLLPQRSFDLCTEL